MNHPKVAQRAAEDARQGLLMTIDPVMNQIHTEAERAIDAHGPGKKGKTEFLETVDKWRDRVGDDVIERVWTVEVVRYCDETTRDEEVVTPGANPLFESFDIRNLLADGIPPTEWHGVPNLFVKGHQIALNAGSESGKSVLALSLAIHMALREPIPGLELPEGDTVDDAVRILYLDKENPVKTTLRRIALIGLDVGEEDGLFYRPFPDIDPLNTEAGAQQVIEFIEANRINFVIIDTQSKFVEGDENSSAVFTELANHLFTYLRKNSITSLTLDHFGKDHRLRGSSAKKDNYDDMWELVVKSRPNKDGVAKLELHSEKNRIGVLPDKVYITRTGHPQPRIAHEFHLGREDVDLTGEDLANAPEMPVSEKIKVLRRLLNDANNAAKIKELKTVNKIREWVINEHDLSFTRAKMNTVIKACLQGSAGGSKGDSA